MMAIRADVKPNPASHASHIRLATEQVVYRISEVCIFYSADPPKIFRFLVPLYNRHIGMGAILPTSRPLTMKAIPNKRGVEKLHPADLPAVPCGPHLLNDVLYAHGGFHELLIEDSVVRRTHACAIGRDLIHDFHKRLGVSIQTVRVSHIQMLYLARADLIHQAGQTIA